MPIPICPVSPQIGNCRSPIHEWSSSLCSTVPVAVRYTSGIAPCAVQHLQVKARPASPPSWECPLAPPPGPPFPCSAGLRSRVWREEEVTTQQPFLSLFQPSLGDLLPGDVLYAPLLLPQHDSAIVAGLGAVQQLGWLCLKQGHISAQSRGWLRPPSTILCRRVFHQLRTTFFGKPIFFF